MSFERKELLSEKILTLGSPKNDSNNKTGIKDFVLIKKIGEGSYSSVWKVRRR